MPETPVAKSTDTIAATQAQRVLAAQAVRSGRKVAKAPAKPATPTRKVRTGTASKPVAKKTVAKRTAPETKAPVLTDSETKALAAESARIQAERITKAREVLAKGDEAAWELAKLTFESTEEDGPARMTKGDWADAIGVSNSQVSRLIKVWREYGNPNARQRTPGKGGRELSFNDHVELAKVSSPAEVAEIKKRMQAEGTSFATAVKRHREANRPSENGQTTKSKDKTLDSLAELSAQALSDDETRLEAWTALGVHAIKALVAFRETLNALSADALAQDTFKQVVRNVLSEQTELEAAFEAKLSD